MSVLQDAGLWLLILHLAFVPLALAARGLRRAGGAGRALRAFAFTALAGALVAASLATFWPRPPRAP